jgi:hypothetical protein
LCTCLKQTDTIASCTEEVDKGRTQTVLLGNHQERQELIRLCTNGTDDTAHNVFRCPACAGCANCKIASKLGIISARALEEQQEIRENLQFITEKKGGRGYYQSRLPLKQDYASHTVGNYDQANDANLRMLRSLENSPSDTKAIQDSFSDLLARGFIVPISDLPKECRESIQAKVNVYIPTSVAYKSSSHSTKVRVCWDLSRKTGMGTPLNAQLLKGAANYSMTETLVAWRRGRYALSCDIAKFYNNLRLHPDHYNLHMAVWRQSMSPSADPEVFALVRHFYGISSTAALMKAVMEDVANKAEALGLDDVAFAIRKAFVDDVSTSLDDMEDVRTLKKQLGDFLLKHSLPVKGFALTGTKPDASLSPTDSIMVGGLHWFPETDMTQLNIPTIFQGRKTKGRFRNGTKFLTGSNTKQEILDFYDGFPVTLAHILSRTASLYDLSGVASPLAGYGRYITRNALLVTGGVLHEQVNAEVKLQFVDYLHQLEQFGKIKIKRNHGF